MAELIGAGLTFKTIHANTDINNINGITISMFDGDIGVADLYYGTLFNARVGGGAIQIVANYEGKIKLRTCRNDDVWTDWVSVK